MRSLAGSHLATNLVAVVVMLVGLVVVRILLVRELFDGSDRGSGSGTIAGRSHVIVQVDPDDFTEAELLAGCEALTDVVDGLPEERASGSVDILISSEMTVGPDGQYLVANEQLIPRENRGSCVVQ